MVEPHFSAVFESLENRPLRKNEKFVGNGLPLDFAVFF